MRLCLRNIEHYASGPGNQRPKSKLWTSLIWTIIPGLAAFEAVLFWGVRAQKAITCTLRGAAKEGKGDLDGALADYDQTIKFNPTFGLAYFGHSGAIQGVRQIKNPDVAL